jgi:hypothetical protein
MKKNKSIESKRKVEKNDKRTVYDGIRTVSARRGICV